jgi:hypothetical protein
MVWTPVFYIFLNKNIRYAIFGKTFDSKRDDTSMSRGKILLFIFMKSTLYPKILVHVLNL